MQKVAAVDFYDSVNDELLKFTVIISKTAGKFVFCKHRERTTYELAGGHRELNESIDDAARRELYEETGAVEYTLVPIGVYSVTTADDRGANTVNYGKLYFADITRFESELHHEIERIIITDALPDALTYPDIYPKLFQEAKRRKII